MALDKNKTGIMAAISAAQVGKAPIKQMSERAHRSLPKGTVGSVRAGLGGIQEIETRQIEDWGPRDRLQLTAVNSTDGAEDIQALADSIATNGQQVPVLLRPSRERDGFFQVVYGRRRILACIRLEIPVKALIRTLDDTEALMAKGLENASRSDLSYYERARFAEAILGQGYSRDEVMQALAISKVTLSQLERITRLVPRAVGDAIGAAPGAGRPKWMSLTAAFEGGAAEQQALEAIEALGQGEISDKRFDAVLKALTKRGAPAQRQTARAPVPGVSIKSAKASVSVTVKRAGDNKAFADWFDQNVDRLIEDSYRSFQSDQEGDLS